MMSVGDVIRWDPDRARVISEPRARQYLTDTGIPVSTILFEAERLTSRTFAANTGQNFVRIGSFDDDFHFFLGVDSGSVYFGVDEDEEPAFGNSRLSDFVECILWVEREFPFYSIDDETSKKREAGLRVSDFLRSTDPICLDMQGGFWMQFVHDVEIGDYYEGSL